MAKLRTVCRYHEIGFNTVLFGCWLCLIFAFLYVQNRAYIILAFILGAICVVSWLFSVFNCSGIFVERTVRSCSRTDDRIQVSLAIHNRSRYPRRRYMR